MPTVLPTYDDLDETTLGDPQATSELDSAVLKSAGKTVGARVHERLKCLLKLQCGEEV
jgi:hypothetical protein